MASAIIAREVSRTLDFLVIVVLNVTLIKLQLSCNLASNWSPFKRGLLGFACSFQLPKNGERSLRISIEKIGQ